MKTTTIILTALLLAAAGNTRAQAPERAVLFTLGPDERVNYNEYFVMQTFRQNHFACVVHDTLKKTFTLVFNGERVATKPYDWAWWHDARLFHVHYMNVREKNGYVIEYLSGAAPGNVYVNRRGTVHGPFHYVEFAEGSDYNLFYYSKTEGNRVNFYVWNNGKEEGPFNNVTFRHRGDPVAGSLFYYRHFGRWYARTLDGKAKLSRLTDNDQYKIPNKYVYQFYWNRESYVCVNGKVIQGEGLRVTESGNYMCYYKKGDKVYFNINGQESRGYYHVEDLHLTESGKYMYRYEENRKYHFNINGQESRGYDYVGRLRLTESGKYMYWYGENRKWHVNINGQKSRGYDNVRNAYLTESGKYMYEYKENGKYHVNVNGQEGRGYDNVGILTLTLTESGKYMYGYNENGKWHVNINGQESRGYDYVGRLRLTESGKYMYYYRENKKGHVNVNGQESRGYDDVEDLTLTESGKYIYRYKENGKWHVNVNGQESRGYDEIGLDSRHWLLAESGDYMYHYKENGKWHVNINGKIHDKAYDASLDDNDGSFSYLFARDDGQLYENTNGTVRETGRLERMTRGVFDSDKYYGSNLDILSDDRKHSLYSSLEYPYVAVDGKRYGAAPALFAWYDREHDTFSWNAIEGRELVCYTLRLK